MPAPSQWGDVALSQTRDQFIAVYRHPFLYSTQKLQRPERPQRTEISVTAQIPLSEMGRDLSPPTVYAISKVQSAFPSMITIGRTANNDVVIDDVQVSRFHAFFRLNGALWELADAGSSNGTLVGRNRLQPKGAAVQVKPGDILRFGGLEFVFMTPSATWDRLVADQDHWGD
jgi:hypothetical protein